MQVPQKNMSKIIENYLLKEVIGQGQYGKVYRSIHQKTNKVFAVKVIKIDKFKSVPKLQEFTINEIETLNSIKNENVVEFVEMLRTQNNVYLVYQFCNGGTLEDLIKKKGFLQEDQAIVMLQQIIFAFKQLFKANILHRDLKPSNILFHDNILKIADFGFCKSLTGPQDMTQTMVGSPIYMAPEILKGDNYNMKADIWSIGVCFFECLFGYCPYEDRTIAKLIMQINTKPLVIPLDKQNISKMSQELLKAMLVTDPERRISWEHLLSHPLFVNYKGQQVSQQQNIPRSISPLQNINNNNSNVNVSRKNTVSSQNSNVSPTRKKEVIRTVEEAIKVPSDYQLKNIQSQNNNNRSVSPNKVYKQVSQTYNNNNFNNNNIINNNNTTTTTTNNFNYSKSNISYVTRQQAYSPEKNVVQVSEQQSENIQNIMLSLKNLNMKRQKVIQNLTFIKWFLQERFSQQFLNENMNRLNNNNVENNDVNKPYLNEVFVFLVIKYSTIRIQHFLKSTKDLQNKLKDCNQNRNNNFQNDQYNNNNNNNNWQQQYQETSIYQTVLDKEFQLFSSLFRQYKNELDKFLKQNNIMDVNGRFNVYNQSIQDIFRETELELQDDQKINEGFFKNYIKCVIQREIMNPGNIPFTHLNSFLESMLYEESDQKMIQNFNNQFNSQNPIKINDQVNIIEYKLKLVTTKHLSVSI